MCENILPGSFKACVLKGVKDIHIQLPESMKICEHHFLVNNSSNVKSESTISGAIGTLLKYFNDLHESTEITLANL